jgi:hypothetical protein
MNSVLTTRKQLQDAIAAIPAIKRFFICVILKRKEHLLARSYSVVTIDLLHGDNPMTDEVWKKSDELWAKLYGINYQPKA